MKPSVMKRAHETEEHVRVKQQLAELLRRCGWIVLVESLCVDLAALHIDLHRVWALEVERSAKWIRRNIEKAFLRGADRIVVVACSQDVAIKARDIVAGMSLEMRQRITVAVIEEVDEQFVREVMEGN